jgi:predicted enzyme related to lactoylglutathione lyase
LRGEGFNPGCKPMPDHWQEIGWVRLTVADLPAMTRFYRDVIGLGFIGMADGCALLDLGDNTTLELAPGGAPRDPPKRQMDSLACIILRVTDVHALVKELKAANVHFVHDMLTSIKGDWTYISDPEGNVVGLSQRAHPGDYCDKAEVRPEDIENARRWAEMKAAMK